MGKRANPAVVGAFVVGAVVILVVAVTLFGSGRLFRTTYPYIVYFTGDVNGLNVGAPVKFKGVEIGSVAKIMLNMGGGARDFSNIVDADDVRIPVIIEIEEQSMYERGGAQPPTPEVIKQLIELGLRAELAMESFVTGILYVKLDIQPNSQLRLVSDANVELVEIPTLPTAMEEVQRQAAAFLARLDDLDVEGLIASLNRTVEGIETLVTSDGLTETIETFPQIAAKLETTIDQINGAVTDLRQMGDGLGERAEVAMTSLTRASDRAGETLVAARETLDTVTGVLDPESPTLYQLNSSLQDLAQASRAIRFLAEELERNPSVLLRGKETGARR